MLVVPDQEVVQGYARCQTCPQPTQLMVSLPPQVNKGIEKFVVDSLKRPGRCQPLHALAVFSELNNKRADFDLVRE